MMDRLVPFTPAGGLHVIDPKNKIRLQVYIYQAGDERIDVEVSLN